MSMLIHPKALRVASKDSLTQASRGFTLFELLVVISIMAVIVGLVFTAGSAALRGSKERATQDVIRTLDAAMQAYLEEREQSRAVDPLHIAFNPTNAKTGDSNNADDALANDAFLILDGRLGESLDQDPIIDSTGLWMTQAQRFPRVKTILDKIPQRFLRQWDPDVDGLAAPGPDRLPTLMTVVDAWNRPIRLVLPRTDGLQVDPPDYSSGRGGEVNIIARGLVPDPADPLSTGWPLRSVLTGTLDYEYPTGTEEVRRNWIDFESSAAETNRIVTDSDGGRCEGPRPYFYSAGPDGIVGLKAVAGPANAFTDYNTDNIYLSRPKFPRVPN